MTKWISLAGIARIVLLFWAVWLSVVVTTNLLNVLVAVGLLPHSLAFTSGNWQWINQVMDPLAVPRALQAVFFAGAISWEALAAVLFWRATRVYRGRPLEQERAALAACAINLALWAAFQVLDEVFLAYQPEQVHRAIFSIKLPPSFCWWCCRKWATIEIAESRMSRQLIQSYRPSRTGNAATSDAKTNAEDTR